MLRGPQFQFGEIAIPSAARYVGARLRPGVETWFLGIAAKQACGSRIALEATGAAMRTGSPEAADQPWRDVERLRQALIRIHGSRDPLRATLGTTALDMISRRHGKISADAVASALGCSARHLRREMIAETGMGPKAAARIVRMRRAIAMLGASDLPLSHVALDAGYADQAHMTREFALLNAPSPAVMRRRSESDFFNTPEASHR